ncbi:unnamed protein product [Penicillium glandicola]
MTTDITHLPVATPIRHTPRAADTPTDKTYHLSGGAITGIVVVSFAAVAIVVLIIFRKRIVGCCGGRDKTPVVDSEQALSPPTYMPPQTQPILQNGDLGWQASEMSEENAIHEIASMDAKSKGNGRVIHELS